MGISAGSIILFIVCVIAGVFIGRTFIKYKKDK
jgi:hypothetical protein